VRLRRRRVHLGAGAVGAIGAALDLQDNGAVHDTVEEGHRQRRVAQVFAPGVEVDVRHQRRRALRAGVDDLVEQVGGLRRFAAFDLVEAKLVDLCGAPHNSMNVELAKM